MPKLNRTVISRTAQDIFADSRHLLGLVAEHRADFARFDEKRERKVAGEHAVAGWTRDLEAAEQASGNMKVALTTTVRATRAEVKARASVYTLLLSLRDDVLLRLDDEHPDAADALGFRNAFKEGSTTNLLDASETVLFAVESGTHAALLGEAGVTPARIKDLTAARKALVKADSTQKVTQGRKTGTAVDKQTSIARVEKNSARIRKIARVVFRGQREVLAKFKSKAPRHAPVARPPKQVQAVEAKQVSQPEAKQVTQPEAKQPEASEPEVRDELAAMRDDKAAKAGEGSKTETEKAKATKPRRTPQRAVTRFRAKARNAGGRAR